MQLLITGSTGFVGRNLLLKVISDTRWSRIILPVRDPVKLRAQLAGEGIEIGNHLRIFRVSDDAWELPSEVQPALVIHAAGRLFGRERGGYFRTNVEGSLNLVRQLPQKARMIALSSLAAGGPTPAGVAARGGHHKDEPVSWYGASKLAMEKELRVRLGGRLCILRPPMVLGPRDEATVPLFQMAKGFLRVKPGLASKHYSWIAVEDLCNALLAAASMQWEGGSETEGAYYLTASETITDGELLSVAAEVLGCRGVSLPVPQAVIRMAALAIDLVPAWREAAPSLGRDRVREILPPRWIADGAAFAERFGWQPRRGLAETLRETAEWLKAQGKI
jgi:nucleoside-diphosphate-sugar epimerase